MWTWLDLHGSKLGVPHGLLRAGEIERFVEAEAAVGAIREEVDGIRQRAQAEAEALVADAAQRAQQIVEEAEQRAQAVADEAFEEGRARGEAEALEAWHARRLDQALEQAVGFEAQQDALARIVMAGVERVLRAEPARGLFEKALAHVGELMREASGATLRVHPDDEPAAREALATTQGLRAPNARIELVCDTALPPGACLFDSEHGSLDASLQVQLAALRSAIAGACVRFAHEQATGEQDE